MRIASRGSVIPPKTSSTRPVSSSLTLIRSGEAMRSPKMPSTVKVSSQIGLRVFGCTLVLHAVRPKTLIITYASHRPEEVTLAVLRSDAEWTVTASEPR